MANNCSKVANCKVAFNQVLNKLGHRSIAHLIDHMWKTTIVYTAASVDGRSYYATTAGGIKAGDIVIGRTSTEPSTYVPWVCTVAPANDTDAGTFVKMIA